jgi:hypothetical protein
VEVSLEEAVAKGKQVLRSFRHLYHEYLSKKDALRKSQGFSIHHSKAQVRLHAHKHLDTEDEDNEDGERSLTHEQHLAEYEVHNTEISENFSIEGVKEVLDRTQDTKMLFVSVEYLNLRPGFSYLFRTRGLNVEGPGPWSTPTYSTFTLPTIPSIPMRPRIAHATLRTILFEWDPPETGGSAITGYDVYLKNAHKHVQLPRAAVSYLWEGLFPGRSYFLKVRARNEVGESEYSEYNDAAHSQTLTGAPEPPPHPHAIAGTWESITLRTRIPYHNGATVSAMEVEQRFVDPFEIGEWVAPFMDGVRSIPDGVTVIESIDFEQQQRELEEHVAQLELLKASTGFSQGGNTSKIDKEIEELIQKQVIICATGYVVLYATIMKENNYFVFVLFCGNIVQC